MPLYIGDYMADTSHLTTEQHGGYLLILMALWKRGGELPDVDENLAAAARLSLQRWRVVRPLLIDGVLLRSDGTSVTQKRLHEEVWRAQQITDVRAEAGAKGGANAQANAQANRKQNNKQTDQQELEQEAKQTSTPSQSHPPFPLVKEDAPRSALSVADLETEGVSREAATEWIAVRKRKKAGPLTPLAWAGFKREVEKAGWSLDAAVRKAVQRNWISFEAAWVAKDSPQHRESAHHRGQRERVAAFAPGVAARTEPPKEIIDVTAVRLG